MGLNKINEIKKALNSHYVSRESTVDMMMLAILSGKNAFLIGEPGLGKTDILKAFSNSVKDFVFFEYQIGFETRMQDLLSVNSNDGIGIDNCHIALLDEFFKGNPSTLNSLLSIMQEKVVYIPKRKEIPLLTIFATSNEKPDSVEGKSMLALYDRFLLREEVMPLRTRDEFIRLMSIDKPFKPETYLTMDDLSACYGEIEKIKIPAEIIAQLYAIRDAIRAYQVKVSDRRFWNLKSVLKASAFLRGDDTVRIEKDIDSIKSSLWTCSSDVQSVEKAFNKMYRGEL